jgi:hypothetical protein
MADDRNTTVEFKVTTECKNNEAHLVVFYKDREGKWEEVCRVIRTGNKAALVVDNWECGGQAHDTETETQATESQEGLLRLLRLTQALIDAANAID